MTEEKKGIGEIGRLLVLLCSAIGAAIVFSFFLIYYYGPTGQYKVNEILLTPEMTKQLSYQQSVEGGRFTFDRTELRYYDENAREMKTFVLTHPDYHKLFRLLEKGESLEAVPSEVISRFNAPNAATITLYTKNDKGAAPFQEITFVNHGDFYRISLRTDNTSESWAYFYHKDIYEKVLALFSLSVGS